MPYATIADLVDRFELEELIQISNPNDGTSTTVNELKCQAALDDVAALVDAKLSSRYKLPLPAVPRVLRNIVCDLARAALYEDRITDRVKERETAALRLLDEIRDGKLMLGLDEAGGPAAGPSGGPTYEAGTRVFTRDTLADYGRDS